MGLVYYACLFSVPSRTNFLLPKDCSFSCTWSHACGCCLGLSQPRTGACGVVNRVCFSAAAGWCRRSSLPHFPARSRCMLSATPCRHYPCATAIANSKQPTPENSGGIRRARYRTPDPRAIVLYLVSRVEAKPNHAHNKRLSPMKEAVSFVTPVHDRECTRKRTSMRNQNVPSRTFSHTSGRLVTSDDTLRPVAYAPPRHGIQLLQRSRDCTHDMRSKSSLPDTTRRAANATSHTS